MFNLNFNEANKKFDGIEFTFLTRFEIKDVSNQIYKSCPKDKCDRKIKETDFGTFSCDKCNENYSISSVNALLKV